MPIIVGNQTRELKPLTGLSTPKWLSAGLFGSSTYSGEVVSPDSVIGIGAFFNGVRLLCETVGQIPVMIYKQEGNRRVPYRDHKAFPLVTLKPNEYMTSYTFNKVMMNHAIRYDNAFALIERDRFSRPISMIPIHPDRVVIRVNDDQRVYYEVDGGYLIDKENMLHLMDYTEDGIVGTSKYEPLKQELGNILATNRFVGEYFGKGVNVSGFIKHKKYLKDAEAVKRLKSSFIKSVKGNFGVGVS